MDPIYADIHKDVIEKCKQGNAKAQFELYKLYSKAMFNISIRMLNSTADAEDVLQEVFIDVFAHLPGFRYESSFGAWIKRITINRCINFMKRNKGLLSFTDDLSTADRAETPAENEPLFSVEKIKAAVSLLPEGYKVIFNLYSFEGYDHAEIAQILDITESTSKSQYLRAKNKLREILQTANN
ncbi:MAG TPA: hypothetical protein DCQ31_04075 [Bacteroidales bacterium]|nr:hypothetical protein [Bacteroidales bacterium]